MEAKILAVIAWLLEGDVSIQYQTRKDLLDQKTDTLKELQERTAVEGWCKALLDLRDPQTRLWGKGVYTPKWISTHYTLLQLKTMGLIPSQPEYVKSSIKLLKSMWHNNDQTGIIRYQDLCVSAMMLSICCYAGIQSNKINEITDYILEKQYPDGGFNCNWDRGDQHSSLHTTLTVLEAFHDYEMYDYKYRLKEIKERIPASEEFILKKRLFRSVNTGEIIHPAMLMLSYPCRWKYDILRCMDYFWSVRKSYDCRMEEAINLIIAKKRDNNRGPVQHKHQGQVHFDMEKTSGDSRWNTLRVLRILRFYKPEIYNECME